MSRPILPERPVLVAPDAFAGLFRASQVAGAIGRGLERAGLMPPDLCPVGATIDVLLPALGGETADGFALLEDGGTALVEAAPSAEATGRLVGAAVDAGAQVVLLAGARHGADSVVDAARPARLVVLSEGPAEDWAGAGAIVEPSGPWVLDALDFDRRMRAARAVICGEGRLDQGTLMGRITGEIGTRTRQAGVPLHAIVGEDALDPFGKRMIDLQRVLEATTLAELEAAGERLGAELRDGLV